MGAFIGEVILVWHLVAKHEGIDNVRTSNPNRFPGVMQTKNHEVCLHGYQRQIQEATGAAAETLPILERIMRDEIFHSTLDWQTALQFNAAARRALKLYQQNRPFYDADQVLQAARWAMSLAETDLQKARESGEVTAIHAAEAAYAEAGAAHERALQRMLSLC